MAISEKNQAMREKQRALKDASGLKRFEATNWGNTPLGTQKKMEARANNTNQTEVPNAVMSTGTQLLEENKKLQEIGLTGVGLKKAADEYAQQNGVDSRTAMAAVRQKALSGQYNKEQINQYGEQGREQVRQLGQQRTGTVQPINRNEPQFTPPQQTAQPEGGFQTREEELQWELDNQRAQTDYFKGEVMVGRKELGTVSGQVADLSSQFQVQQDQLQNLFASLNNKSQGLGDQVMQALQNVADSGGSLDDNQLQQIQTAVQNETDPQKINEIVQGISGGQILPQEQAPEQQPFVETPNAFPTEIQVPASQQYQSLVKSGMTSSQIIQSNPELASKVKPDGTIINPNTGVGLIQTPQGQAYQLQSGILVPRDPATGFPALNMIAPEDVSKMSYLDIMSMNLSIQQSSSQMQDYYNAEAMKKMYAQNENDKKIRDLEVDKFYNENTNRLNESRIETKL